MSPNGTPTILVVDDNELFEQELVDTLKEDLGYNAEGYHNARGALDAVRARPTYYQFVLLDLILPEGEGDSPTITVAFNTIERITQINPDIRVIVYTANQLSQNQIDESERKGAFRCVVIEPGQNLATRCHELVETVRTLDQISQDIKETLGTRNWARGLLEVLDVDIYVIDDEYKTWVMDIKHPELKENLTFQPGYPCWRVFHNAQWQSKPCQRCPVKQAFEYRKQTETLMLSKVRDRVHYFHKNVTPLMHDNREEPFAVLGAVKLIDGSHPLLSKLSLEERMKLVTDAIVTHGYDSATILAMKGGGATLRKASGSGYDPQNAAKDELYLWEDLNVHEVVKGRKPQEFRSEDYHSDLLSGIIGLSRSDCWLLYPLITQDLPVGVLRVDLNDKNKPMKETGFDLN